MSWTDFLTTIFIVYLLYYLLNLFFDLFLSPRVSTEENFEDEHFFAETFSPELITLEEKPQEAAADSAKEEKPAVVISSGPVSSSGGVSLKQLFSLAKDNLIEHTRAIPY